MMSAMKQFVTDFLRSETGNPVDPLGNLLGLGDGIGNVGIVAGAAGRIKAIQVIGGGFETQPAPGATKINGSVQNVTARLLMSAVAGDVNSIAAIHAAKNINITGALVGADKDPVGPTRDYFDLEGGIVDTPVLGGGLKDGAFISDNRVPRSTANRACSSCKQNLISPRKGPGKPGPFLFASNDCRKTLRCLAANMPHSMSDPVSPESQEQTAPAVSLPSPEMFQSKLSELMNQHFGDNTDFEDQFQERPDPFVFDKLPRDIKEHLDRFVIKQDEAKKVLSIAVCDHYNHIRHLRSLAAEDADRARRLEYVKQNVLLIGPTGVGKTYLVKHIAELIGVPFVKADCHEVLRDRLRRRRRGGARARSCP
jgi:hypothetical protein